MPSTSDLTPELAKSLSEEAARLGGTLPESAVRLLEGSRSPAHKLGTGAELVEYWRAAGVIGSRPDILDSQAEARSLREEAQRRGS
jgi:hypothetical protein